MQLSTRNPIRLAALLVTTWGAFSIVGAQDMEYVRALERTQKERPATLTSVARIAPENEPGTPLACTGGCSPPMARRRSPTRLCSRTTPTAQVSTIALAFRDTRGACAAG
jgi:hypothetical protein